MTSPKLESLAVELKVMILKEMDAESILLLISASPTFHRIFYAYYNEIIKHSVSFSSGIRVEVLNDALAAASLPHPRNMDNVDVETIVDRDAAEEAVEFWKARKFSFLPTKSSSPARVPSGCMVPMVLGYPDQKFYLHHAVAVSRLGSYIEHFIHDYAAKAKCDPLRDFYAYNNVPSWAHPTLGSKKRTSPIRSNETMRLTEHELIKFQRAFFRFEFYSRVHAHLGTFDEYIRSKNPLLQLAPSETEEVACVYGYLYSLQMLVLEEMHEKHTNMNLFHSQPQAYPILHDVRTLYEMANGWDVDCCRHSQQLALRVHLTQGVKRVWNSVVQPYEVRKRLVWDASMDWIIECLPEARRRFFMDDRGFFMSGVLNGDPQCCIRRCCNNQWGQATYERGTLRTFILVPTDAGGAGRFDEGGVMSSGIMPNYPWDKWRKRQIKHKKSQRRGASKDTHREAEYIIAARRMGGWVFWDDSTLHHLHRWRMSDFKAIDLQGFLAEKDPKGFLATKNNNNNNNDNTNSEH